MFNLGSTWFSDEKQVAFSMPNDDLPETYDNFNKIKKDYFLFKVDDK